MTPFIICVVDYVEVHSMHVQDVSGRAQVIDDDLNNLKRNASGVTTKWKKRMAGEGWRRNCGCGIAWGGGGGMM